MFNLFTFIIQSIFIIGFTIIIIFLLRHNAATKFEERIGKYSIKSKKKNDLSLTEIITIKYNKFIKKSRKNVDKLFGSSKKKYEKYISYKNKDDIKPIDFITNKLLISLVFILTMLFSSFIKINKFNLITMFIGAIFGYYVLDIYLYFREKRRKKLIETEILRAIIIMNNAFKSGKSILQAVELASQKLPEPINDEFKRIYHDINYGMNIDKVFERFAKRVDIEEVKYISSSLTILSKTGGNIVKVFSSIEKTLFAKKKLKEELKNLTASSNLLVKVLLFVPFIFTLLIYFLNPTYFDPFFESTIGYILMVIIFMIFILYVWFLEKIMKVKV